jgi:hypothetical protein
MRLLPTLLLPILVAALSASPGAVQAQRAANPAGNYATTFEVVVDNCDGAGSKLDKATVTISQAGPVLTVKIPSLPDMKGKPGKSGKLRAEAKTVANTLSVRSKFAFNGKVSGSALQAVLVAEYFKGDKPQCTQSWSVVGTSASK